MASLDDQIKKAKKQLEEEKKKKELRQIQEKIKKQKGTSPGKKKIKSIGKGFISGMNRLADNW